MFSPSLSPIPWSGFYAADWSGGDASKGEGGETLTVVDKNEAWVFHVLGDDTGSSAVWAAQRVPDDHVAAIANQVSEDGILFLFLLHHTPILPYQSITSHHVSTLTTSCIH